MTLLIIRVLLERTRHTRRIISPLLPSLQEQAKREHTSRQALEASLRHPRKLVPQGSSGLAGRERQQITAND